MRWIFFLLAFSPLVASADPPVFDKASTLRFNTVCSHCHEGQCSGRLTFSLGPEATFTHIRRYAGDVDDDFARQLMNFLELRKKECASPPLAELDIRHTVHKEALPGEYFPPGRAFNQQAESVGLGK